MGEYFIDPYTKYFNNLETTSTLGSKITSVGEGEDKIDTSYEYLTEKERVMDI